jgi:hypothetical protein
LSFARIYLLILQYFDVRTVFVGHLFRQWSLNIELLPRMRVVTPAHQAFRGLPMLKSTAVNSIAAVVAAALVASLAVYPTAIVPEAKAEAPLQAMLFQPDTTVKADVCLLQGWPYYEQGCQFDLRVPASEKRIVRVIALR